MSTRSWALLVKCRSFLSVNKLCIGVVESSFCLCQVARYRFLLTWYCIQLTLMFKLYIYSTLANSDHLGLSLSMKTDNLPSNFFPHRRVWKYKHAANEMLWGMNLNDILDLNDIQTSWLCFKTAFLDVVEQCIPRSVVPNRQNLPWLTTTIIQLIKKRNYYFKKAYQTALTTQNSNSLGTKLYLNCN